MIYQRDTDNKIIFLWKIHKNASFDNNSEEFYCFFKQKPTILIKSDDLEHTPHVAVLDVNSFVSPAESECSYKFETVCPVVAEINHPKIIKSNSFLGDVPNPRYTDNMQPTLIKVNQNYATKYVLVFGGAERGGATLYFYRIEQSY